VYAGSGPADLSNNRPQLWVALQRRPHLPPRIDHRRRTGRGNAGRHPGNLDPRPGGL